VFVKFVTLSILALFSLTSFAATNTFFGSCSITSPQGEVVQHKFSLHEDSMVQVGAFDMKVQVVNNIGTDYAEPFYALGFAIDFDRDNTLRSPPELCPTRPQDARVACQERNARSHPPYIPAPQDKFTFMQPNPGILDSIYTQIQGENGEIGIAQSLYPIYEDQVVSGLRKTKTLTLNGVKVTCDIRFN
jgi:hypothetical protein